MLGRSRGGPRDKESVDCGQALKVCKREIPASRGGGESDHDRGRVGESRWLFDASRPSSGEISLRSSSCAWWLRPREVAEGAVDPEALPFRLAQRRNQREPQSTDPAAESYNGPRSLRRSGDAQHYRPTCFDRSPPCRRSPHHGLACLLRARPVWLRAYLQAGSLRNSPDRLSSAYRCSETRPSLVRRTSRCASK